MIVHLVASAEYIEKDINDLRDLIDIFHKEGHTLACNWVEPAYARVKEKSKGEQQKTVNWQAIYKENMAAITKADVVVAESTLRSFGTGYQIATAARLKKPVLILRRDSVENDIMAIGVTDKLVQFQTYNDRNIEDVLTAFLRENDIKNKDLRFNFFVDREIYGYLRWASHETGKTKSEILRTLVREEIKKQNM